MRHVLALIQDHAVTNDTATKHGFEVIDFDIDRGSNLTRLKGAKQGGAHRRVGQRKQHPSMHHAMGIHVNGLQIQGPSAVTLGSLQQLDSDVLGEL